MTDLTVRCQVLLDVKLYESVKLYTEENGYNSISMAIREIIKKEIENCKTA